MTAVRPERVVLLLVPEGGIGQDVFVDAPEVVDSKAGICLSHGPLHRSVGAILVIARIWLMTIIRANTRFSPTTDHDDSMDVIRHYDRLIQDHAGEIVRDGPSASGGHSPQRVQPHFAVHHMAEQVRPLVGAHRHEIRAGRHGVPCPYTRRMERLMMFVSQPPFNPLDPPLPSKLRSEVPHSKLWGI